MARLPRLRRDDAIISGAAPSLKHQRDWQIVVEAIEDIDEQVGILTTTISGSLNPFSSRTLTATGTLTSTDYLVLVDCTGGAVTVNLPSAATSNGQIYVIKKIDASANAVTIDGAGADTIDGATTVLVTVQYEAVMIACDGSEWWVI